MLAAEAGLESASSATLEHKVRSAGDALAALSLGSEGGGLAAGSESPPDSVSSATLSPPSASARPLAAPIDIAGPRASPSASSLLRAGSSGRLSFLSCFSAGNGATLDDEPPPSACECEVGIRPSFYWVDAPASEEQRVEAEESMRFLKADCQDEARVIQNFAGIQGLTFVGVFDGHGPHGRAAAKLASDRLPEALAAQTAAMHSRSERKRLKAMREACRKVHAAMAVPSQAGFDASLSGTTACFALVSSGPRGPRVLLANVGDSRAVLARARSDGSGVDASALTIDAKPSLPGESKRITACGGIVRQLLDEQGQRRGAHRVFARGDDVLPGLAMSRSLGDTYAHSVGVTWEPMLSAHSLTARDQFLVIGTDGLWDVMSAEDAGDFVQRYRQRRDPGVSCAEALTLEAQERWKAAHDEALVDDISVAILHFTPMPPAESEASLPRTLSRAASCNDEANALVSAWARAAGQNPSHRSPRPLFGYLYRTGEAAGSGDFWDSLPRDAPGSPGRIAAAEAAEAAGEAQPPVGPPPPSVPRAIATSARPAPPQSPLVSPPQGITIKTTAPRTEDPAEHAVHGGHSLRTPRHLATLEEATEAGSGAAGGGGDASAPYGSSIGRSQPIPMSLGRSIPGRTSSFLFNATASAPAVPGVLTSADVLRPVRKAYPSAANMHSMHSIHSVPSWGDDAFSPFFADSMSLPHGGGAAAGTGLGTDTPRSSESERSTHMVRPRRFEGRHEGKVRRGVPASMSSTGLASCGRASTDSEPFSLSNSRVGSMEEGAATLAAAATATGGSSRGAFHVGSLSPKQGPGLPRSMSHGSLVGSGGRSVTVLRPIPDSTAVAAGRW